MKLTTLALAALLFWSGPASASRLTVCNEYQSDTLWITMLYQSGYFPPFDEAWKVYGWMNVAPGTCQPLVQHPGIVDTFLSVRRKTRSGRAYIMHFPLDEPVSESNAAERFFCVQENPFDRVLKELDAHEACPAGWYAQLFNLYVRVPKDTNYTLRLGRGP